MIQPGGCRAVIKARQAVAATSDTPSSLPAYPASLLLARLCAVCDCAIAEAKAAGGTLLGALALQKVHVA